MSTWAERRGRCAGERGRRWPAGAVAVLLALVPLAGACGSSSASSSTSERAPATAQRPRPAGRLPSPIATMVCQPEAQREIALALGVKATVGPKAWVNHRYSCPYVYADGRFTLSIQELSSWSQTLGYFHGLARQLGQVRTLENLGQGAFQTTNGSVVVRKDWKVLLVDVSQLPPRFGRPPTSSADVAVTIADVILSCWAGD